MAAKPNVRAETVVHKRPKLGAVPTAPRDKDDARFDRLVY